MTARNCPSLFISAPASGQGKTTITAGLAYLHRKQGRIVRVFKTGPDFLDPMILERASGNSVYQIDLWMNGEDDCRRLLYDAAQDADLILIEGVMGLFDGNPSSADLAELFGIPILAVINAESMAQTFSAIAHGLQTFRPTVPFAGVLANNVASARHKQMLEEGCPQGVKYFGGISRNPEISIPARHLGLMQAEEIEDLDERLQVVAESLEKTELIEIPKAVKFMAPNMVHNEMLKLLDGMTIGIARDRAFSFLYQANIELLCRMGAKISFFSPLMDKSAPAVDNLYFPGGYPELFLAELENNRPMRKSIHKHFDQGKNIYAECGGMLYMLDSLTDKSGNTGKMVGLFPGNAIMQGKLRSLGYQSVDLGYGELRGHTFHHSETTVTIPPVGFGKRMHDNAPGEPVFRRESLLAGYLHLYFPSNPQAAAALFTPVR